MKGSSQNEHNNSSVLRTLLIFSVAIFTLPIAAYFATINYLDENYNIPLSDSYIYGVISAVIVVNLIIAAYIYLAFREEKTTKTD